MSYPRHSCSERAGLNLDSAICTPTPKQEQLANGNRSFVPVTEKLYDSSPSDDAEQLIRSDDGSVLL